ncbi:MAG: nicotinate (nicotinamide) nucleotide adenylyltransferase [Actinobacteria bacterium]|nr:nicotinate (nicotinamide) nucleotide adenylyltransferase [Actinomycetota bacterium]
MPISLVAFGGTFDPLHWGHIAMLKSVVRVPSIETVRIIPNRMPTHKGPCVASSKDRLAMLAAMQGQWPNRVDGSVYYQIDTQELDRSEDSYTYLTVAALDRELKGPFYRLLGSDSLFSLHTWKEVGRVLEKVHFLVAARSEFDRQEWQRYYQRYLNGVPESQFVFLDHQINSVASREIRKGLGDASKRIGLERQVPGPVAQYIQRHGLYQGHKEDE